MGVIVDRAPRRVFIGLGFVMAALANMLMGPSQLLSLPDSFIIFVVGHALKGVSQAAIYIPILPEVQEAVYIKQGLVEGENEAIDAVINDKSASIYGLIYSVGAILAQILGSTIYEVLLDKNWASTCDVFGIIAAIWAAVFICVNLVPDLHKEKR